MYLVFFCWPVLIMANSVWPLAPFWISSRYSGFLGFSQNVLFSPWCVTGISFLVIWFSWSCHSGNGSVKSICIFVILFSSSCSAGFMSSSCICCCSIFSSSSVIQFFMFWLFVIVFFSPIIL